VLCIVHEITFVLLCFLTYIHGHLQFSWLCLNLQGKSGDSLFFSLNQIFFFLFFFSFFQTTSYMWPDLKKMLAHVPHLGDLIMIIDIDHVFHEGSMQI